MPVSVYGSYSGYSSTRPSGDARRLADAQQKVQGSERIVTSSIRSEQLSGLDGGNVVSTLSTSNGVRALGAQNLKLDAAVTRLTLMDNALKQISQIVANAKNVWLGNSNDNGNKAVREAAMRDTAASAIDKISDLLRTKDQNEYIFSGQAGDVDPIEVVKDRLILEEYPDAYYRGSRLQKELYVQGLGKGPITLEVKADNDCFQKIYVALYKMRDLATDDVVSQLFRGGLGELNEDQMKLGLTLKDVKGLKEQNQKALLELKKSWSGTVEVPLGEASEQFNKDVDSLNLQTAMMERLRKIKKPWDLS